MDQDQDKPISIAYPSLFTYIEMGDSGDSDVETQGMEISGLQSNCEMKEDYFWHLANGDRKDFADSMLEGFSNEKEAGKKFKSKNLDAERRRRCKLNTKLLTLRTLVPNITKMSKESTLVDAVNYIQSLEKQIYELKLELSSIPETKKEKQVSSSSIESITPEFLFQSPGNIDLYPMGRNKFHVNITCKKTAGNFAKLLDAVVRYGLEITDISFSTFGGYNHIMFCVEAKERKEISAAELRKILLVFVGGSDEN